MNKDELLRDYAKKVSQFQGKNYPLTSREGSELETIFYELLEIEEKELSPEMRSQKRKLESTLIQEKLRGLV